MSVNPEELSNRFRYHPANDEDTAARHAAVRVLCHDLAVQINNICPAGREAALALTNLEQVMFWANAAIARNGVVQASD